ncbi:hypothetical protein KFK09_014152 [Dendrobium nobile]|uniref:Uncharacterized protein n=1 Tax=Dendrobium nobile TaxID=94219 RepID=A0A8T3B960_DENNO|nr:hypothetical protein KFK09_014152 [Dendrobium nobile]
MGRIRHYLSVGQNSGVTRASDRMLASLERRAKFRRYGGGVSSLQSLSSSLLVSTPFSLEMRCLFIDILEWHDL